VQISAGEGLLAGLQALGRNGLKSADGFRGGGSLPPAWSLSAISPTQVGVLGSRTDAAKKSSVRRRSTSGLCIGNVTGPRLARTISLAGLSRPLPVYVTGQVFESPQRGLHTSLVPGGDVLWTRLRRPHHLRARDPPLDPAPAAQPARQGNRPLHALLLADPPGRSCRTRGIGRRSATHPAEDACRRDLGRDQGARPRRPRGA